jgi:hypothetical protein
MDEGPVRLCAYVYPDAESNGEYGHLFNECLARTTKFLRPPLRVRAWAKASQVGGHRISKSLLLCGTVQMGGGISKAGLDRRVGDRA